jgi:VWFA-related protein
MIRTVYVLFFALASAGLLPAADSDVVFRSQVSLVRVDAQVIDRDNRPITGLRPEDFVLREEGRPLQIRNFAREDMPVDVLLLLDVSASMRPHVQRIASAAHQALQALGNDDRVAIMVFDRTARLRLPFRSSRDDVEREFKTLLRQETFNGGTDIAGGLLEAADYVARSARREARRAIVILTDDQTERDRDEAGVPHALVKADAVLSALIAPDAMRNRPLSPGMGRGGTWPGQGRSRGGIIFGPGGPMGGPRSRPPGATGPRTHPAGVAQIARESGGDSMPVDQASALETTLARIRQRYALHFLSPEGARPGQRRTIDVALSEAASRRYPDAEVRFRRFYLAPDRPVGVAARGDEPDQAGPSPGMKRRPAVSEPAGPRGANPSVGVGSPAPAEPKPEPAPASQPGWRRVKPGEQP